MWEALAEAVARGAKNPKYINCRHEAVAVAMADGPRSGLAIIDELDAGGDLKEYHLLHASRADPHLVPHRILRTGCRGLTPVRRSVLGGAGHPRRARAVRLELGANAVALRDRTHPIQHLYGGFPELHRAPLERGMTARRVDTEQL